MDLRFESTNRIISCRTDQIRASVQPRRTQRFPTRGPLDGTLTLSRFGGKYTWVLFRVILVIYLRINALDGGLRDHAREFGRGTMNKSINLAERVRFGTFELNVRTGEL